MFKLIKRINTFALCGLLSVICGGAAIAATGGLVSPNPTPTARPAISLGVYPVAGVGGPRMPTLRPVTNIPGGTTGGTTGGVVTTTDKECIDSYLDCTKTGEVCGPNFEDCTNNSLFFARKSGCASILLTCPSNAIHQLYGTNNTGILATRSTTEKDDNGEFVFIYPTENSILGSMIVGASISQRLNTQDCVRRYTQCLKRDDVCGADFELCTSDSEFRKQKVFCSSTLARCQLEGRKELWGTTDVTANPQSGGRIRDMIDEGAALAAVNAVATCYKVVDNCILQACAPNPYLCKEGANSSIVDIVEEYTETATTGSENPGRRRGRGGASATTTTVTSWTVTTPNDLGPVNRAEISGLIRNACFDTIGANRYCYSTVKGSMPTASQLANEENKEDVFADMYASRFNNSMKAKIDEMIDKFAARQKARCSDTIVQCAMRHCGEGVGSVCYSSAFNETTKVLDITQAKPLREIQMGCAAVVNSDIACRFAAATFDTGSGHLMYEEDAGIFAKLFTSPTATEGLRDPVGAVAALNARLATSFSAAALEGMKRQCQSIAQSCVKNMCGTDFQNCFRNRTDIVSAIGGMPDNRAAGNRVAGVLDRAIVIGLCINTVKTNQTCEEHIRVETAKIKNATAQGDSVWGGATSARQGWLDGGVANYDVKFTETVQMRDANGALLCLADASNLADFGRCDGSDDIRDTNGKVIKSYTIPYMVSNNDYAVRMAENQIFQQLIFDLELEAQAIYNAKLTRQMNMCHAENAGGIMGNKDMYSTFMWARLKSNKVPNDYSIFGLSDNQLQASNDLYGSFCRVRVELRSTDPRIKKWLEDGYWSRTNFAVGDSFVCGSWIPQADLEGISQDVYEETYLSEMKGAGTTRRWATVAGTVVGALGGAAGMNALQKGGFGSLIGTNRQTANDINDQRVRVCRGEVEKAITSLQDSGALCAMQGKQVINGEGNNAGFTYVGDSRYITGKTASNGNALCVSNLSAANAIANMTAILSNNRCGAFKGEEGSGNFWSGGGGKTLVNVGGAAIGALAFNAITNRAVKDAQESAADKAAEEAAKEWMDNIGKKIRCYIGAEEIGMFGDFRSTTME
ncbi:MAG: hypothetical protein FWG18_00725 [Alphaproteobacteria bacterium]|nr:hypothetical protein [Alphaproteobacteria bacterium]